MLPDGHQQDLPESFRHPADRMLLIAVHTCSLGDRRPRGQGQLLGAMPGLLAVVAS